MDHGTAFDIAGKGIANELSLIEAIDYAENARGRPRCGRLEDPDMTMNDLPVPSS